MKKVFFSFAALCLIAIQSMAQNTFPATGSVGIGTTSPAASSLLEVRSTTKGFLAPRMTNAQRNAIGAPATGLLIYQTDGTAGYYYYYGSGWRLLLYSAANTSLSNLGSSTAVNRSLTPGTTGTIDLGSTTNRWRKGFFTDSIISRTLNVGGSSVPIGVRATGSGYGINATGGTYGVYGSGTSYGVYGNNSGSNYGVYGNSTSGYGVYGSGGYTGLYGSGTSYGVIGSGNTYGIYGVSSTYLGIYGSGPTYGMYGYSASQVGVYGYTGGGTGDESGVYGYNAGYGYGVRAYANYGSGIYATGGSYAGYFVGSVYASAGYVSSDQKLKKNISDVTNGMDIINKLKPREYEFKQDGNFKLMKLPEGKQYGLIAQEVEQVLPTLVKESKFDTRMAQAPKFSADGKPVPEDAAARPSEEIDFKALNYTALIPIIIKGMQEQQAQIKELIAKNTELQNQLDELKSSRSIGSSAAPGAVSGFLKQNVPNPSAGVTTISYFVPENTGRAQIIVTDVKGSLLKTYTAGKGSGQISIRMGELPAGTYSYSLLVDNQRVDSKQMVIER